MTLTGMLRAIISQGLRATPAGVSFQLAGARTVGLHTSACLKMDISGMYPPIATPFNQDETIAYDKLEQNIERWNKIPFRGYVVLGSNGEYPYLTGEERLDLVGRVTSLASSDKLIIAGAGCESTRDTISMTQKMADAGAKAVLIVTPCFYKGLMTNDALISHYTKVADASPVPIIIYSVPGNTAIDVPPEVIVTLSEHPNIVGLKDSGGDVSKLGYVVWKTKNNNFQVLAGSASFLLPAYSVGGVGGVCALANVLGQECCTLDELFRQGKMEESKDLQHRLIGPNTAVSCVGGVCGLANVLGQECCDMWPLYTAEKYSEAMALQHRLIAPNWGVTKRFGVPGLKRAMEWYGFYGGPTRSPIQPLSQGNEEILRKVFQQSGFLS